MEIKAFRQTLGSFLTGVTVVTTINEQGQPLGFTANSFTSVSLNPPLVLVCLAKTSANCNHFAKAKHYAVNILSESQRAVSNTFASPVEDRFAQLTWQSQRTGCPIISGCVAWLDCNMQQVVDAGDHLIFIGEVVAFAHTTSDPLGYLRGNYVSFGLEQEAAAAMEDPNQATRVGIILEDQQRIYLLAQDGALSLPTASKLGHGKDKDSLAGLVSELGGNLNASYLFAVFEDKKHNVLNIYYRTETNGLHASGSGKFFGFDEIDFDQLPDRATKAMLKRYIAERSQDTFGIYVGDETSGSVEVLKTTKKRPATPL